MDPEVTDCGQQPGETIPQCHIIITIGVSSTAAEFLLALTVLSKNAVACIHSLLFNFLSSCTEILINNNLLGFSMNGFRSKHCDLGKEKLCNFKHLNNALKLCYKQKLICFLVK